MIAFFDLDGTLEDSRQDMALSINRVRSAKSLAELPLEEARSLVNRGMDPLVQAAFPEIIQNEVDLKRIRAQYEEDYLAHVTDHTALYPGIAEAVRALCEKGKLIVYTNKPERISRELLRRLGILECFAAIIGGDSFPESKPSPIPMRVTAERVGASGRAWMTGDTAADMNAALNFGAEAVWAAWGYIAEQPEPRSRFKATSPADLTTIIQP